MSDYHHTFANPFKAAELGYIDEIIMPADTRLRLIRTLGMLQNKRRKLAGEELVIDGWKLSGHI